MIRRKLKRGGRPKAIFGVDGAIQAAATIAAAATQAKATIDSAKSQSKATIDSAKMQADSIAEVNKTNTDLQNKNINFNKMENEKFRQQQQDIQMALQMQAGQSNMDDYNMRNRVALKKGGSVRRKLKAIQSFYGEAQPFSVTDGGAAIPVNVDNGGFGLYELYGDDHEHYHKTRGGKYKSGVGVRMPDGQVIEGEGNQNSNQGEYMYVTPGDVKFISKHNINGFNPAQAINAGMHPEDAFVAQEMSKGMAKLDEDGSRVKSLKRTKAIGGLASKPLFGTFFEPNHFKGGPAYGKLKSGATVSGFTAPLQTNTNTNTNTNNTSTSNIQNWMKSHSGALFNAAGNLIGGTIASIANGVAGRQIANAYTVAGQKLSDAYANLKGIDMSNFDRANYDAAHSLAVVNSANTNINPALQKLQQQKNDLIKRSVRNTVSSAAQRASLATANTAINSEMNDRYAYKDNEDMKIREANAGRITQVASDNANRDMQANAQYRQDLFKALEYNADIHNQSVLGQAQALADARTQSATANAQGIQSSINALATGLTGAAGAIGRSYELQDKYRRELAMYREGYDTTNKVNAIIKDGDKVAAQEFYNDNKDNPYFKSFIDRLIGSGLVKV